MAAGNGSWVAVSSPNAGAGPDYDDQLRGAACADTRDCWAVGVNDTSSPSQTLVEQDTGGGWSIVPSPSPGTGGNQLNGAACVAGTTFCIGVGYYYASGGNDQTLVEYDGKVVSSPDVGTSGSVLNGVACVTISDCWAVGDSSTSTVGSQTLTEHYDGTSWTVATSMDVTGSNDYLYGVSCDSTVRCVAAGYSSGATSSQTLVEENDGGGWFIPTSPSPSTSTNQLNGVTCDTDNFCSAVGYYYTGSGYDALIEQSTGGAWTVASSADPGSYNLLYGAGCTSGCFAVGDQSTATSFASTLIEQHTGDPSRTSVRCTPDPVAVGRAAGCTAHVADTLIPGSVPSGAVTWSSAGAGSFNRSTCTLSGGTCTVSFTPSSATVHTIKATYGGDATQQGSQGTTTLRVS